jgi:hypothetical protein
MRLVAGVVMGGWMSSQLSRQRLLGLSPEGFLATLQIMLISAQ